MLILRRRVGETLLIGEDVEIEVLESGSWGVKVGIRAPQGVFILRKELRTTGEANAAAAKRSVAGAAAALGARFFGIGLMERARGGDKGR